MSWLSYFNFQEIKKLWQKKLDKTGGDISGDLTVNGSKVLTADRLNQNFKTTSADLTLTSTYQTLARFTAPESGRYIIQINAHFLGGATANSGLTRLIRTLNGSTSEFAMLKIVTAGNYESHNYITIQDLAAGDILELQAQSDSTEVKFSHNYSRAIITQLQ